MVPPDGVPCRHDGRFASLLLCGIAATTGKQRKLAIIQVFFEGGTNSFFPEPFATARLPVFKAWLQSRPLHPDD
jgi:hypothetical protein